MGGAHDFSCVDLNGYFMRSIRGQPIQTDYIMGLCLVSYWDQCFFLLQVVLSSGWQFITFTTRGKTQAASLTKAVRWHTEGEHSIFNVFISYP